MLSDEEILLMKSSRENFFVALNKLYRFFAQREEQDLMQQTTMLIQKVSKVQCDHHIDHYKLQLYGYELYKLREKKNKLIKEEAK